MFSLIVTIIAIALVVILAIAVLYYGGTFTGKGQVKASATTLLNQVHQIAAAALFVESQGGAWPEGSPTFGPPYLTAMPVPPKRAYLSEAPAVSDWAYYLSDGSSHHLALKAKIRKDVCMALNDAQGVLGIPAVWDGVTQLQCFGLNEPYTLIYEPSGTTSAQKATALDKSKQDGGSATPGYPRLCPDGTSKNSPADGVCAASDSTGSSAEPSAGGGSLPQSVLFMQGGSQVTSLAIGSASQVLLTVKNNTATPFNGWIDGSWHGLISLPNQNSCGQDQANNIPAFLAPGSTCDLAFSVNNGVDGPNAGDYNDTLSFYQGDAWDPIAPMVSVSLTIPRNLGVASFSPGGTGTAVGGTVTGTTANGVWPSSVSYTDGNGTTVPVAGYNFAAVTNHGNSPQKVWVTITGGAGGTVVNYQYPNVITTSVAPNIMTEVTLPRVRYGTNQVDLFLGNNNYPVVQPTLTGQITVTTESGQSATWNYTVTNNP